ncbi:hypothetical protein Ancab_023423 [Ancistrocladus abbreviatus]
METPSPQPQPIAKPSRVMPVINVTLRIFTLIFLIISLIILTIDKETIYYTDGTSFDFHFQNFTAYRYMVFSIVVGKVYIFVQISFTLYRVVTTRYLMTGKSNIYFDFYGDKAFSYLLATATAAGFGASVDLKRNFGDAGLNDFFNKAAASASLLLVAFLLSAASSIISSFALRTSPTYI